MVTSKANIETIADANAIQSAVSRPFGDGDDGLAPIVCLSNSKIAIPAISR